MATKKRTVKRTPPFKRQSRSKKRIPLKVVENTDSAYHPTSLKVWDTEAGHYVFVQLDHADKDKILYMLTTGRQIPMGNSETRVEEKSLTPVSMTGTDLKKNTATESGRLEVNVRRAAIQAYTLANLVVRLSEPIATLVGEKSLEPSPVIDITPENLLVSMDIVHDYNQRTLGILEEFVHRMNDMV